MNSGGKLRATGQRSQAEPSILTVVRGLLLGSVSSWRDDPAVVAVQLNGMPQRAYELRSEMIDSLVTGRSGIVD